MANVTYFQDRNGLTIFNLVPGKTTMVSKTRGNYDDILKALKAKAYDKLRSIVDLAGAINEIASKNGQRIIAQGGLVKYINAEGTQFTLAEVLAEKVVEDIGAGYRPSSLINFIENLAKNRRDFARAELYDFLNSGKVCITADGHFLAYKKVRNDYFDIFSGTMLNKMGAVVTMSEKDVTIDRNNTCAAGLHFCSFDYLNHYGSSIGNRVMIVKVNPADVVSIPSDYRNQKGRTWKYKVVGELDQGVTNTVFESNFITEESKSAAAKKITWFFNEDKVGDKLKTSLNKVTKAAIKAIQAEEFAKEKELFELNGYLDVYRAEAGDIPRAYVEDLDGRARDLRTGRFVAKTARFSQCSFKTFKEAQK